MMLYNNNRICSFIVSIFTLVPILLITGEANAQNQPAMVSGRVITSNGEPISDIDIGIGVIRSTTDSNGRFTIKNIPSSHTKFNIYDKINVRAIKFGNIAFYYHGSNWHDSLNYALKPGANINNIEIITSPQLKIKGQIVFKDGEPLADTFVQINFDTLSTGSDSGSRFKKTLQTDSKGNFENIVYSQGVYVLSINYRGLTVESTPFFVHENVQHESIVLTLDGGPNDLDELVTELSNDNSSRDYYGVPDIPGVWIVNPENGHAYKWVKCKNWIDAKVIADKENAHLVSITTEEEQIWLESIFTHRAYWIGLTDFNIEGKWEWETGEPVTFTNWGVPEKDLLRLTKHPLSFLNFLDNEDRRPHHEDEMNDYAVFSGDATWGDVSGKWQQANQTGGRGVGQVSMAILEKKLE